MAKSDPQMILRVPAELREQIRDRAAANRRSMTGEIVHLLENQLAKAVGVESAREATRADVA